MRSNLEGVPAAPVSPAVYGLTKVAYSVNETMQILSLGRATLYKLVNQGDLTPRRLGKKTLFYAYDIAAFLGKLGTKKRTDYPRRSKTAAQAEASA